MSRYELGRRLGAGGVGVVHAAHDPHLGREVAVKLIRTGSSNRSAFRRLEREAKALARVSHPGVVGVFDVGRYDARHQPWPDDVPPVGVYIVMELVRGQDLQQWLETPRPIHEVLAVFEAAGRGLAAAHAAGVVHRDFKPANVIIDEHGTVKVLDFGLAQWLHVVIPTSQDTHDDEEPTVLRGMLTTMTGTAAGTVMGTPAYMAPEQHRGEKVDARSDQYAFCVALTEALCGVRPFAGVTVADLHRAKSGQRMDPHTKAIPARLRTVIERGLAVDPDERWPSMDALLDALQTPRSRSLWWGGAAVAVALGATGWLLSLPAPETPVVAPPPDTVEVDTPSRHVLSPAAATLRRDAERAFADREDIGAVLRRFAPDDEALPEDDPSLAAELLLWRGHMREDAASLELLRRAFFLAREAEVPSTAARAAMAIAMAVVGDHGAALAEWTRHAWVALEQGPWDRRAAIEVAVTSAYGRAVAINDEHTRAALERAGEIVGETQPDDDTYIAYRLTQLSSGWRYVDEPERAMTWARRAEALLDAVGGPGHPLRPLVEEEIGQALWAMDRCDEALPHLERAHQGYLARGKGAIEIEAALIPIRIGDCLVELDRLEEAIVEYRRALGYFDRLEDRSPNIMQIRAHIDIARLSKQLGHTEDAIAAYEAGLALVDPNGMDHRLRKQAQDELAALREQAAPEGGARRKRE